MRLDPVNAVSSFHYYMWNAWSEEECKITFGGAYKHFWEKWNSLASKSILERQNASMPNSRITIVRCW